MKYKKSKYNVTTCVDRKWIIANTLKGTMIEIEKEEYEIFQNIDSCDDALILSKSELFATMERVGIILQSQVDEDKYLKYFYWKTKEDDSILNITINPSFMCNLNCQYCYQNGRSQKEVISTEILQRIYRFAVSKITKKTRKVMINWFGGEALIHIDIFLEFAIKLKEYCNKNDIIYETTISTNGVLLTDKNIEKLKQIKTVNIQTTLAGNECDHDKLRPDKNGGGTFKKIIENIKRAKSEIQNILVIVNLTKTNVGRIEDMLDNLKYNGIEDNAYIVFKRVLEYGIEGNREIVLDIDEYNQYVYKFSKYAISIGLTLGNMSNFKPSFINCYSGHKNTYAIDYNGNVFRCIERACNESKIGVINCNGQLVDKKNVLHSYFDVFDDPRCYNCSVLPSCGGGCISRRAIGEHYCEDFAKDLENTLKIVYKYHKSKL